MTTNSLLCGIPSVTLLGDRGDWVRILKRLDMLPRLGSEPAQFCDLLKPVLGYFVLILLIQPFLVSGVGLHIDAMEAAMQGIFAAG
jgi:hypothetical protein